MFHFVSCVESSKIKTINVPDLHISQNDWTNVQDFIRLHCDSGNQSLRRKADKQNQHKVFVTKRNKSKTQTIMYPTALLFVGPKQGGILQSSGFLNLQSLMSLSRTCKAHALDELSLTLLIDNEITRNHQVFTLEEAIHFLKRVCQKPLLRQWIAGVRIGQSIGLTRQLLFEAVCYDVMLVKMLRATPESFRSQFLNHHQRNEFESTLLHRAALSDNPESIKAILAFYPESQRFSGLE